MPETSIVIKTQDASSAGLKTIAKNAADLGSKLRDLQDKAYSLSKEKATLNADFDKAKKELADAKKKFNETRGQVAGENAAKIILDALTAPAYEIFKRVYSHTQENTPFILHQCTVQGKRPTSAQQEITPFPESLWQRTHRLRRRATANA